MELIKILLFLSALVLASSEEIVEENYAAPYFSLKSGFYNKKIKFRNFFD